MLLMPELLLASGHGSDKTIAGRNRNKFRFLYGCPHHSDRYANNRAEVSHEPAERLMREFNSIG